MSVSLPLLPLMQLLSVLPAKVSALVPMAVRFCTVDANVTDAEADPCPVLMPVLAALGIMSNALLITVVSLPPPPTSVATPLHVSSISTSLLARTTSASALPVNVSAALPVPVRRCTFSAKAAYKNARATRTSVTAGTTRSPLRLNARANARLRPNCPRLTLLSEANKISRIEFMLSLIGGRF